MKRSLPLLAPVLLLIANCSSAPSGGDAGGLAPIAPQPERGTEPMGSDSALAVWYAGSEALLADPRDAGMRRAFSLLDDRLRELADGDEEALFALRCASAIGAGPLSLRVDIGGNQMIPLSGQIEVGAGGAAEAIALEREIENVFRQMGIEGEPTPLGPIEHQLVGESDNTRVIVSIGGLDPEPIDFGSMDLPLGVEPTIAVHFDMGQFTELLGMFMAGDPEAEQLMGFLSSLGLVGDDGMAISFACGTGDDGIGYMATRTRNYVPAMREAGALEVNPITADEIGMIPTDAVSAQITQSDVSAMLGYLDLMEGELGGDPIEMIQGLTGVHLERDLFDHIGTTMGWYTSDSTGGGGMMSLVMFLEVTNEDGLRETIDYGVQMLNDVMASEADGMVEMRDWMHRNAVCSTLTFPGLPIPLEVSMAIHDGFLFFTMSPQALAFALDQRASRGLGLAANPAFRAAARGSLDDLISLNYTDTQRRARDGYWLSTLVMSALANGVRLPEDPAYDPGIVLPSYTELVAGGQASVILGRIEGDDLVQTGTGDPSVAANVTALLGSPLVLGVAALVGTAVGGSMMAMPMMMGGGMQPMPVIQAEVAPREWEAEDEAISDEELEELLKGLGYLGDEEEGGDEAGSNDGDGGERRQQVRATPPAPKVPSEPSLISLLQGLLEPEPVQAFEYSVF